MKNVFNPLSGQFDLVNTFTDSNFTHNQISPSSVWMIVHNLGKKCSVQVTDDSGNEIIANIQWIDNNNVSISFNSPTTGFVYCN